MTSENDKNVPLIVCDFHTKEVRGTHLVFQKRRFQSVIFEILRAISLLEEKFIFFQLPWDNQNFQEFQTFYVYQCCPSDKLFRLWFCFKYSRSYKVL